MPPTQLQHPPFWRVLRTALALVAGLAGLTPAAVALFDAVGISLPGPLVLAVGSVAVLVATKVNAALADAGNVPVWRTAVQVLTALAAVVTPAGVALASAGVELDTARILAGLGAATLLVAGFQNLLEARGVVPTLGALPAPSSASCPGCDPVAPHGRNGELIDPGEVR